MDEIKRNKTGKNKENSNLMYKRLTQLIPHNPLEMPMAIHTNNAYLKEMAKQTGLSYAHNPNKLKRIKSKKRCL